jgi:hypothetical protein
MVDLGYSVVWLAVPLRDWLGGYPLEPLLTRRVSRHFDVRDRQEVDRVRRFRKVLEELDGGE